MDFIQDICSHGGECYIVGGCIRNILFSQNHNIPFPEIKDVDLLVRLLDLDQLEKILSKYGTIKEVGKSFGVIKFKSYVVTIDNLDPKKFDLLHKLQCFDIALPRTEKSIGCGYKEFEIQSNPMLTLKEDFQRRDATINAIGLQVYNIIDIIDTIFGTIHHVSVRDPIHGLDDIINKLWRAVGNPNDRFKEDPTRIMRALRQSVELDIEIEENTRLSIVSNRELLKKIIETSPVRLIDELLRMLNSPNTNKLLEIINFMDLFGFFDILGITENTYFEEAIIQKSSITHKVALLLMMNENVELWSKEHDLSASQYFKASNVPIVISFNKYNAKLNQVTTEYELLKVCCCIEKDYNKKGKYIALECIKCMQYYNSNQYIILQQLYENVKDKPLSASELNIDGLYISKKLRIAGRHIGVVKNILLENIFKNKIKNEENELKNELNNIISNDILQNDTT